MGGRVKLRIFPREESYFDLFDEVAANLVAAALLRFACFPHRREGT